VLGTFSGYALVASDEGECLRLKYEDSGDSIEITFKESVDVPSYGIEDVDSFLESESKKVIDLWSSGRLTEAEEKLKALAHMVPLRKPTVNGAYDRWVEALEVKRQWETILEGKKSDIEEALGEVDISSRTKFHRLYDGSISERELGNYKDLVGENLRQIREKVASLREDVTCAKTTVSGLITAFENNPALISFSAFVEDLLEDVRRIDTIAEESTVHVRSVARLGHLSDLLAGKLARATGALNFIETMATRLSKSLAGGTDE
jgi:hypothetical protein